MPYIESRTRSALDRRGVGAPATVGELTYVLYRTCLDYLGPNPRFTHFAEVLGALSATENEFYRRQVAPYEDIKILQNGDVYA